MSFDVVHHVSYGSLPGGSIPRRLGRPFVFGPLGGGQTAPPKFLPYFGRFRRSEPVAQLSLPAISGSTSGRQFKSARCSTVLCANEETVRLARRMGATKVEKMLTVCLPDDQVPSRPRHTPRGWRGCASLVGWALAGPQGAATDGGAFYLVPPSVRVELDVIGAGPVEQEFRSWLDGAQLVHPVKLKCWLPLSEVHEAYEDADVFILISLRDTDGMQYLEAMAQTRRLSLR